MASETQVNRIKMLADRTTPLVLPTNRLIGYRSLEKAGLIEILGKTGTMSLSGGGIRYMTWEVRLTDKARTILAAN
jgi:hypothetical protein